MALKIALAQIAPVWLDRAATLDKIVDQVEKAASGGANLVVFGEALLPGYPFWPELTGGAKFESDVQKDLFAHYAENSADISRGTLDPLTEKAAELGIAIYVGTIEHAAERGGFSLYATLVYISPDGNIGSSHRKLMPTYEERLVWSPGDGHGLRVHSLGEFTVGGLNCWENWMPLPRAALYGQGENLHIAVWPVVSVSGMMHRDWIPDEVPHADLIRASASGWLADGGSCVAGPGGNWLLEPFDPAGHYSRPDVTRLKVNRKRQKTVSFD
jgi:nitrilase